MAITASPTSSRESEARLSQTMPEQRGNLRQPQLPLAGAVNQRKQRAKFILGCHQCGECGSQNVDVPRDQQRCLATRAIGGHVRHAGTTAPELSSCSV